MGSEAVCRTVELGAQWGLELCVELEEHSGVWR